MGDLDKLKELENITNRIHTNMNTILNSAKTSELDGLIQNLNNDLKTQNRLRVETGIDKNNSNTAQIQTIKKSLKEQDKISKQFGFKESSDLNDMGKVFQATNKIKKFSEQKSGYVNNSQPSQASISNNISTPPTPKLNRTEENYWGALGFLGIKSIKPILGIIGKFDPTGIVNGLIDVWDTVWAAIEEIISVVDKFADKMQGIVDGTDEAIRTTIQSMGLVTDKMFGDKTKVDKLVQNILDSGRYMVQQLEIPFDPIKVAEFQKAYSDLSKTTIGFHETDYVTLGEIQQILNLTAQESANLTNMFINMGGEVKTVSSFFNSLMTDANKSGVNAKDLINDIGEFFNASQLFKFQGGVQDMSRIMAYAKRIKIDIGGMFKLMDKVSTPEASIDLAAQLQALDTVFLGLDPLDLMGAAMTDVERFTGMIMSPIMDNIDKYFDNNANQLTQFGRNFSRSFVKLEGVNEVFKSEKEFTEFLMKQGKEKTVREALMNSASSYAEWAQLTPDEQKNIVGVIASQYQKDSKGLKITTTGKYLTEMSTEDMRNLMKSGATGNTEEERLKNMAQGTVSISDRVKVNEMLVASMSQNIPSINALNTLLTSNDLLDSLRFVGNTIMDVGLEVYTNTTFKQMEIMQQLGLTAKEAYLYSDLLMDQNNNLFAAGIKALVSTLPYLSLGAIDLEENDMERKPSVQTKSHGGIVNAKKITIPRNSIKSTPASIGGSVNGAQLQNLLVSFSTNKFGSGIVSQSQLSGTEIIVSGEIRNYINDKDVGVISGDNILKILEKQLV